MIEITETQALEFGCCGLEQKPMFSFEHYDKQHPRGALKYRSPREFRRLAAASI